MDVLVPAFERTEPAFRLQVIAVGSGEAFALGRRGDADLLITHAPDDEAEFVRRGFGEESTTIMSSHFVIVGPAADPARVRAAMSVEDALRRVAGAAAPFLTRGDSSGTHRQEMALWRQAGLSPWRDGAAWYRESGVGMAELLRVAGERAAYTLSDRGTFLVVGETTGLTILYDDASESLYNPYAATIVKDARQKEGARAFYEWLRGPGQAVIGTYGQERFGRPLFEPSIRPG